ncbi:porin family protein [Pontibacter qinzhouensis]|uniref:Porin family protein n=1 Tax=Pontibacter qinzhouensis TaxID=2603253 RepID=A0A5C8JJT9_9BACT|nr:outer membrane beta-barrel protein [Pontibacter qinzhouensis]TXK37878.1 porin family protein [Pontibacter qinzhouensis]
MKTRSYTHLTQLLSFLCLCLFSGAGCRMVYTPTMQNVPLLHEKGDLQLVANVQNLQTAYALSDHVAVMANGSYHQARWTMGSTPSQREQDYKSNRYNVEGAVGYFRPIVDKVSWEVYGGAGLGQVHLHNHPLIFGWGNTYPDEQLEYTANTRKVFIQPAIGLADKTVELSFSSRLVALQLQNIQTTYTQEQLQYDKLANLDQHMHLFLEPCVTARFGFKWLKLQTQFLHSARLTKQEIRHNPFVLNFSLQFNLSKQNRQEIFR